MEKEKKESLDFIRQIVKEDNELGKYDGKVYTRFPPEPNGYLHIGHAKAICLSFDIAAENKGKCNLRFDDTNPYKEKQVFIDSIQEDIHWLGYEWDKLCFASDYFETLYEYAVKLIKSGKAYICNLNANQIREYRGTLTKLGTKSPYRDRPIAENLELFEKMKLGEFEEGECVLRAKIDMSSPNMNMRDPVMYRILHTEHPRTGKKWCIYPSYDFTHGESDSIEKITHSLCDLGFENHRPLYNWFIENLKIFPSRQIEFARLNITYTILSKRKLKTLVDKNYVEGWDDPRMPTLSGMRRRGYTPTAIKTFLRKIGVAKSKSTVDVKLLEHCVRDHLNDITPRKMGVLNPLKIIITNYPEDKEVLLVAKNHPSDDSMGTRKIPFSKEIYIEQEDFMENPPKKFWRLSPGREIRLRYAYFITCNDFVKDEETGEIKELYCTYDPKTRGGNSPDGRKVKGTLHWVSKKHALKVDINLYDRLFKTMYPMKTEEGEDFTSNLNPNSKKVLKNVPVEPSLTNAEKGYIFQFERMGYFCVETNNFSPANETTDAKIVINRTIALRDSWAKIEKKIKNS
ncbi:MAG: glutamine--tRNA ligase/YqeY domain fusion protein [Candidatus Cloacimonadota bacterium]|nr:glutamine--tRNA ligase/YqeY domain fusion protein [Candidatus Cloacimonadota bacterium]